MWTGITFTYGIYLNNFDIFATKLNKRDPKKKNRYYGIINSSIGSYINESSTFLLHFLSFFLSSSIIFKLNLCVIAYDFKFNERIHTYILPAWFWCIYLFIKEYSMSLFNSQLKMMMMMIIWYWDVFSMSEKCIKCLHIIHIKFFRELTKWLIKTLSNKIKCVNII